VQAAGFDAPAREDTLTGTRPGELIHAAFELTGFVDRGYQTADLKASGVIGISMRHLDSSTWHLDAASQGVGLVASPRVCRAPFLFAHLLLTFTCISFVFESYHLHFVECCIMAIPFAIWHMFDVCRRSLRSKSLAALNVAGDTMTYNSPIRCCTARSQATPNVASAGARSSSGLSLAGGDELTRAMELIILIDVDSQRVSWVGFTNFTFTFYVHLSSLCVWLLSFAFCLYNVIFYMWLIKCSLVARN